MSVVCPTVTASSQEEYLDQLDTVSRFADRIHIDLADGVFANQLVAIGNITLPEQLETDIHLMYQLPETVLPSLIALQPSLVIVQAEADGDLLDIADHLNQHDIDFGVSLLQPTAVSEVVDLVKRASHVLIFSGTLGSFGGTADLSLLRKVTEIKQLHPTVEIGWDGGIQAENVQKLVQGGIDVLNVGGAIQKAMQPENAYRDLLRRSVS